MQNLNPQAKSANSFDCSDIGQPLDEENTNFCVDGLLMQPIKLDELNNYLWRSSSLEELLFRVKRLLSHAGITDFSHTRLEVPADALESFGTYNNEMIRQYGREGFHLDDLALQYALSQPAPFFRSIIDVHILAAPYQMKLFERHSACCDFLRANGIRDAYNIPIADKADNNYRALISFSIENCPPDLFKEIIVKHQRALQILASIVDFVGRNKFQKYFHSRRLKPNMLLCPGPLNLLNALAKDLTLNEAAEVAGISISTANQHIAEIKRRLRAYTTHGALLIALREGLVVPN